MSAPGFWNDQQTAQAIVQRVKALKGWVEPFSSMDARVRSALELDEMLEADPDAELVQEVER